MSKGKLRVFVTDGFWRKTLAAVRGLGRVGIHVTVGESTYLAPAFFSRYCSKVVRTPSPVLHPSRYIDFLERYLRLHPHDVLIPMEEETLMLLARHRERFEALTHLLFADYDCLAFVRDKLKIAKHAESLGIPVPRTYEVESLEHGMSISGELPYPLVVKPRAGSGSAGVEYVESPGKLFAALKRAFMFGRMPMIQERLPQAGSGIGASFLIDRSGEVKAGFVHRRLREYPVKGGPSTLRESFIHERAKEYGIRLLQSIGFIGVAMVEFKIDSRDGEPRLLEVNPRFWGSLALAIDAGVNFPFLMTLAALGRDFDPVTTYKPGHRCRWLLPGDILHFMENPDRWRMQPSFFRFSDPDLTYDIIDMKDPLPVLGTILALWPYLRSSDYEHVRGRR